MATPKVLVLTGYGINCEDETAVAFERAGGKADVVHINDLIEGKKKMADYQILAVPGGFSYGDDTGSGNAFASRMRNHLWEDVVKFVSGDRLVIGICNGFQILVNLGLLPALGGRYGERSVALLHNASARYVNRWVDLEFTPRQAQGLRGGGNSPWVKGLGPMSAPVAHGEGRFFAKPEVLAELNAKGLIAARYVKGDICEYQGLEPNPNGALEDIAAITDESGRVLGMMPHPERGMYFLQLPNWPLLKEQMKREGKGLPEDGAGGVAPGLKIFENGVRYFG